MLNISIEKKDFKIIMIFLLISLCLPIVLTHQNLKIYDSLNQSLEYWDKEHLLRAIFKLVFLNTIRSLPMYIVVFTISNSLEIFYKQSKRMKEKFILIFLFVPLMYQLIKIFYNIDLPVGKTYVLSIIWLLFYTRFEFKNIKTLEKYLVFLLFVFGIHWLDIIPFFNFLKVGEITVDINRIGKVLEAESIINIFCLSYFLFFILFSILLLYFIKGREELAEKYTIESENRYLKEAQQLVHDLKTPIFSIGTLIEILKIQEENNKKLDYICKIEKTLDKTNLMIGDILHSKSTSKFLIKDIIKFIMSFLSTNSKIEKLIFKNYIDEISYLKGNKSILSRAIINLIVNSWEANAENVIVDCRAYKNKFIIAIEDDGEGLQNNIKIEEILKGGVSTKKSSGKGVSFVKKALEDMDGKLLLLEKNKGLKILLQLKGERINGKKNINN